MDASWTIVEWAGRILFSAVFISSGMAHLMSNQMLAGYAKAKGVPLASATVYVTGVQIIAGAVMILVGWHPIVGALLLVAFLVPTAFIIHNFWTITDPAQRMGDMPHFFKDLSLAGGALLYAVMLHRAGVPL